MALVLGIILTGWVLLAVLTSMLIPRRSASIVARAVGTGTWAAARLPMRAMRTYGSQDRWLSGVAPVSVILQLAVYAVALIATLGLVVFGTSELTMQQAVYQSGATFTTLGIVETTTDASSAVTFVAAFLGLVVVAIFIGYLMALYGSYVNRESQMTRISGYAGEPAWGPEIIVRAHLSGAPAQTAPDVRDWINWACEVRTSQTVTPVLAHFRSTGSTRHWVVSLLAVLDAVALRAALNPEESDAATISLLSEGSVAFGVLAGHSQSALENWRVQREAREALACTREVSADDLEHAGLTRQEWSDAVDYLVRAGVGDEITWATAAPRFLALRSLYAAHGLDLARRLHAVPAPWSGQRVPVMPVLWPERAGLEQQR